MDEKRNKQGGQARGRDGLGCAGVSPDPALFSLLAILVVAASVAVGASDDRPGFDRAACSGLAFPIEGLSAPTGAQRDHSRPAAALRKVIKDPPVEIDGHIPKHHWRLVIRKQALAVFGSGDALRINLLMLRKGGGGAWKFAGYDSGCKPVVIKNGARGESWRLDPAAPSPNAATTHLALLLSERNCNSGEPPDPERILPPRIDYAPRSITITYRIEPPKGFQDCPGAPPAMVSVELKEALGDRTLRDGGFVVPRDRHP